MDPKYTKLIDQYLSGLLSNADKLIFESELSQSAALQQEVVLQRSIMDAAARASQRQTINEAAKRYRRKKMLRNGGISALISIVVASTILIISNSKKTEQTEKNNELARISVETKTKMDKNKDFSNIPIQYFQIPEHGTVHLSEQGVLISVPEAAFLKNGEPYYGNIILQYQEAIRGVDIIKSGLSTMTGDQLLETQGMFSVTGYSEDGEALHFNPEVGVYIQAPVDDCVSDMQLYDGEKQNDGSINWVNPEPLNKLPIKADMADLDFYPECYEGELDKLKWKKDKASRDSLYLSLEHEMDISVLKNDIITGSRPIGPKKLEIVTLAEDMGVVYRKNISVRQRIAGIDEGIAWEFSRKRLENNVWQITAAAIIAKGYYIPTMDNVDEMIRTQLLIGTSDELEIVENPRCSSPIRNITTKSGPMRGYTDELKITAKVQVKSKYQIQVPVRAVFRLSAYDMNYRRALRGGDMALWESPEERIQRYNKLAETQMEGEFILPSKVMAFWKPGFNNTILSTREFEERMQAIHKLCDNEILDLYTNNLDKRISDIDREVVKLGYNEFKVFADQNIGDVNPDNPHIALLNEFYAKTTGMLREDALSRVKTEEAKIKQWNIIVNNQSLLERDLAIKRNRQYARNLDNFSRKNILAQYRNTQGFRITKGSNNAPTSRKNIDALRPFAGYPLANRVMIEKKIDIREKVKYNDLIVQVANIRKYDDVYLYLFADEINSYQRLNPDTNGIVNCLLHDKISYAIGVVGITEDGYSYHERDFLKGGDLGKIDLEPVSEKELEAKIQKMNHKRLSGSDFIGGELNWLRTKSKSYKVQAMYKDMIEFRRQIKAAIFPCVTYSDPGDLSAEAIEAAAPEISIGQ